ncbi:hypothetical protein BVG80_01830 [Sphingobacteriales bacterium TSM_CSM]|nr:hypothetical protein BVG80_01830 [Sphingobacteriales bacterium TSM_CSM]
MEQKLQQIARKLYEEGIEKAEIEAAEIIQKAQMQAADIIQQAQTEKQTLLTHAQAEAEALKSRTHAELQLVISRAMEKLKQDIAALITQKAVDLPVEQALNSNETIAGLLPEVVKQLFEGGKGQITIRVAPDKEIYVAGILAKQIAAVLEQEPVILPDKNIASGFKIGKTGQNYVISFTDEDFKTYIGNFMHPEIAKIFRNNE